MNLSSSLPSFQVTLHTLLDMETAQEIANDFAVCGDIQPDVMLANSYSETHNPETLFRGYMQDYAAEHHSEEVMLERTGYGDAHN